MSDGIQLIHSNGNGDPDVRGGERHWIRVTSNPHPTLVNQLAAGGQYPHADCGEADVESTLRDRGIADPIRTIEHEAGATDRGTSGEALVHALAAVGVAATLHTGTLGAGYVMNPLGGRLISPAAYGPYRAATANQFVAISTAGPWDNGGDMSTLSEAQTNDLWHAVFTPVAIDGGVASYPAKPNNIDIIRRKLSGYAKGYPAAEGAEVTIPAATGSATLTAAETAALAQIPAILAILERFEAAFRTA